MAGSRKEYDLIFKIAAEVGGSFNKSFGSVSKEMSSLQQAAQSTNRTLRDIDGYTRTQSALEKINPEWQNWRLNTRDCRQR